MLQTILRNIITQCNIEQLKLDHNCIVYKDGDKSFILAYDLGMNLFSYEWRSVSSVISSSIDLKDPNSIKEITDRIKRSCNVLRENVKV